MIEAPVGLAMSDRLLPLLQMRFNRSPITANLASEGVVTRLRALDSLYLTYEGAIFYSLGFKVDIVWHGP
ncbi:MAG TPA: hypothetical protein VKA15_03835, partial [Isosphaeraceae bacterium]|nr:hypothetical protein [Isosphaeraceae bacterium]